MTYVDNAVDQFDGVGKLATMFGYRERQWLRKGLDADGILRASAMSGIAVAFALAAGWHGSQAQAQDAVPKFDPAIRSEFREPVTLASKDGVLEVTLTPRQSNARLDTVAKPVKNICSSITISVQWNCVQRPDVGRHQYPAPTLQVEPGERLIVHINNELRNLTIRDFYDPKYTPRASRFRSIPAMMTSAPFNLHVHGAHVSPRGNADNVLLHIAPACRTRTCTTSQEHDAGHVLVSQPPAHAHGVADVLRSRRSARVGRADSEIPLVTQNTIPIRTMLLQYNTVFDRMGGLAQITNPNWPQWVSTLIPPKGNELANGTYRPLLAPVNFLESKKGTQWATVWYAGPLSINNMRGRFQFVPSNLQRFTAGLGRSRRR